MRKRIPPSCVQPDRRSVLFFESHSARVINEILSVARYDELRNVETISAHTE